MATVREITGYVCIAAINRTSLLAVAQSFRKRFPDARIVLCADDDWKQTPNAGFADAKAAAKAVGGILAIPEFGEGRGEKDTDFNDLHRHVGAEAVRAGIERAEASENAAGNGEDTKADAAPKHGHPAGFRMTSKGLICSNLSEPESPDVVVSGCFEIVAESREDTGNNSGVLLRWKDPDGRSRDWAMPRSLLAGDGLEVRRSLLDGGLYVSAGTRARGLLTTYLASVHVTARSRAVASTGWFGSTFVFPDGAIGATPLDEHVILQTLHFVDHAYNVRGTLDEWQENIAQYAAGNSRLVLAISAAFAAALVGPCGAESGGLHLRGRSSVGKSTALAVAGSVWGGGDRGFMRSWRATSNGLDATAATHSDALLCLDEIAQLSGREAGEVAYMLAASQGKARASRDATLRKRPQWRLLFLSTGEIFACRQNRRGFARPPPGGWPTG